MFTVTATVPNYIWCDDCGGHWLVIELFFCGVEKIIFIQMVCKYSLHQCAHELTNCRSCKYMVQWLVIIVKEPSSETLNVS